MSKYAISSQVLELSEHNNYLELTRRSCYYDYPNANKIQLNSDTAEEMAETLVHQPVVAKYKKIAGKDDLGGHEFSKDKNGNPIFGTTAIGTNIEVEVKDDEVELCNGKSVTTPCLFVKSRVWKRNKNVCAAIKRLYDLGKLYSSWEIAYNTEDAEKNDDNVVSLSKYLFESDCFLGSKSFPAYGKCATTLCMASEEENTEMLIAEALANDIYNSMDKEGKVDMTENEKNIVEDVISEEEKKKKTEDIDSIDNNEDKKKQDKNAVASLTEWDIKCKIEKAVENKNFKHAWICFMFPAENYVLVKCCGEGLNDLDYLKFTYAVDENDEVSIGEPEKITLTVSVSEINSTLAEKDDALINANNEIQLLKAENENLLSYKKRCDEEDSEKEKAEVAEKQNKLKDYALNSGQITKAELDTDEFKTIISELNETKLKSIIADRVVASLDKKGSSKVTVSEKAEQPKANINSSADGESTIEKNDYRSVINSFLKK